MRTGAWSAIGRTGQGDEERVGRVGAGFYLSLVLSGEIAAESLPASVSIWWAGSGQFLADRPLNSHLGPVDIRGSPG